MEVGGAILRQGRERSAQKVIVSFALGTDREARYCLSAPEDSSLLSPVL